MEGPGGPEGEQYPTPRSCAGPGVRSQNRGAHPSPAGTDRQERGHLWAWRGSHVAPARHCPLHAAQRHSSPGAVGKLDFCMKSLGSKC